MHLHTLYKNILTNRGLKPLRDGNPFICERTKQELRTFFFSVQRAHTTGAIPVGTGNENIEMFACLLVEITPQKGIDPIYFMRWLFNTWRDTKQRGGVNVSNPPLIPELSAIKTTIGRQIRANECSTGCSSICNCRDADLTWRTDSVVLAGSAAASITVESIVPNDFDIITTDVNLENILRIGLRTLFKYESIIQVSAQDCSTVGYDSGITGVVSSKFFFGRKMCINCLTLTNNLSINSFISRFDVRECKTLVRIDGTMFQCGTIRRMYRLPKSKKIHIDLTAVHPERFKKYVDRVGLENVTIVKDETVVSNLNEQRWNQLGKGPCTCIIDAKLCDRHGGMWKKYVHSKQLVCLSDRLRNHGHSTLHDLSFSI